MKMCKVLLIAPLLVATILPLPATAQYRDNRNNQDHRDNRGNQHFNDGFRNGARGGQYYDSRYDHSRQDDNNRYYNDRRPDQGGIGPGKGALIGAGGGAVLGALFGGGLKGTIIGGAAGAGIGAVVGQANQNRRRDNYYGR
jgi:hypothetical protein